MIPILYPSTETEFENNGLGMLNEAISCSVTQEINGEYELKMQYPITGRRFNDLELRNIILAKPDKITDAQPFRIYRITKPLNGKISIYARHIAYDLMGIPVSPFEAQSLSLTLLSLRENVATECPFEFATDKAVNGAFVCSIPKSIWDVLGGTEGSILDVYHGEYEFDKYLITLKNKRGSNRGVSIRYGKNMTDLQQDANCANCWTGVYPYWYNSETTVTLDEKIINAEGTFDYTRILPLDCGQYFTQQPTMEELRERAEQYITDNDIGVPTVSWRVEFAQLAQSEEYKNIALLEDVYIGDTVSVVFDKLNVSASARAVSIEYNVLLDRYTSVTLGSVRSNIASTIAAQTKEIAEKPTRTLTENIASSLAKSVMGANGGSIRVIDTNDDGEPDTLYIADNPDPEQAVKVWRWNYEGWAASNTGYNGDFVFGATLEDGILANAITAANLTTGTIQSADGSTFFLNLDEGVMRMNAQYIALNGNSLGDFLDISFDEQGKPIVRLGAADSAILLKLFNDRIAFYDMNGTELAYWTNNAFRLVELQSFQIGVMQTVVQPNGSISIVGGNV